ncbi:unnamed protein product [Rotaria sp. Silwood1]|nr:unnamed protein product [Rotaria sp. Silwood1]
MIGLLDFRFVARKKIENEKNINISYWEFSLSQLVIYSARSRLHDRHKLQLKKKLQQIKQEQNISSNHQSTNKENEIKSFEDSENECLYAYEQAHYSPILTHINEFDIEIQKMCVDDMDDVEKLKQQRQSVMKSKSIQTNIGNISQGFVQNPNDLEAGSDTIIDTGYHWNQYNRTHYDINNPPPKIVNQEWDKSYKHGFRCQFQNNIFQLWFNFSKWKYRR